MLKKFATITLVLGPIINIYAFPGFDKIGLGILCIAIIMALCLFMTQKENIKIKFGNYEVFYVYSILITLIMGMFLQNTNMVSVTIRFLQYSFFFFTIVWIGYNYFDLREGIRTYRLATIFVSVMLIAQYVLYYLFSYNINLFLTALPLNYAEGFNNAQELYDYRLLQHAVYFRPSSIFLEPAHFAYYVIPYFVIELCQDKKFNSVRIFTCALIVAAVCLSTSFGGIATLAIIGGIYTLKYSKSNREKALVIMMIIISVSITQISQEFWENIWIRLNQFDTTTIYAGSNNTRVLFGYYLFSDIDIMNKVFGVGQPYIREYLLTCNSYWFAVAGYDPYMNSLAMILITSGVVGTCIYMVWFVNLFRASSSYMAKMLLVTLLIFMSFSSFFNSFSYILILSFVHSTNKKLHPKCRI